MATTTVFILSPKTSDKTGLYLAPGANGRSLTLSSTEYDWTVLNANVTASQITSGQPPYTTAFKGSDGLYLAAAGTITVGEGVPLVMSTSEKSALQFTSVGSQEGKGYQLTVTSLSGQVFLIVDAAGNPILGPDNKSLWVVETTNSSGS